MDQEPNPTGIIPISDKDNKSQKLISSENCYYNIKVKRILIQKKKNRKK